MSFIGVLLNAFLSYVYLAYYPTVLQIAFEPDATVIVAEMLLFVLLLMLARRSSIRNPFSAGYLLHPRITGSLIGCFGLLACYVAVNIMMKQPLPGSPSGQLLATIVDQIGPWITAAVIAVIGLQFLLFGLRLLRDTFHSKTYH
ncbi:MAG: hypothetical protein IPI97_02790 [Nitrosomonas sp.]|nr:hypothetical protein [Nitrosomonas sp.]